MEHGTYSYYVNKKCRCAACTEAARLKSVVRRQTHPNEGPHHSRKFRAQRQEWVQGLKQAQGCVDCGYNDHPAALEFDHVTGPKLFNIGSGGRRTKADILEEIKKCEVVCANCHRVRTNERRANERMLV